MTKRKVAKKRKAAKPRKLKIKKIKLPKDTILHIDPAPIAVLNPYRTAIAVVNAPDKVPERGKTWVDFLFGRK